MKRIISFLIILLFTIKITFSEVIMIRNWDGFSNAVFIRDNIIITNKHCLEIVFNSFIVYSNYKQVFVKTEEIKFFDNRDLIVVKVDRNDLKEILNLKEEKKIGLKEKYKNITIKSIWLNNYIETIVGFVWDIDKDILVLLNTPVYQGMSGSGVYMDNNLIGIISKGNREGKVIIEIITPDIIEYINQN